MPLDWDVKLDSVSISDKIKSFTISDSKGSYVRELTLTSGYKDFSSLFDFSTLPTENVEVLTKIDTAWVSQGFFFIEKPTSSTDPDSISNSVWGRSSTAKLGEPFAYKVSKDWDTDTTCYTIINEMAALCDVDVTFLINDYPIVANTYVVDNLYPIDVIIELAGYAAGYVVCTRDGELIIKPEVFHPSVADHTFTDTDIVDISENVDIPDFGNRIRVSASGLGSGYSLTLEADGDCLNSDGVSQGKLLAFVKDSESEPVSDVVVDWSIEEGGATLSNTQSVTGSYFLSNKIHNASNYYTVTVDYPVSEVLGIWAYADSGYSHNFWDSEYGEIDGSTLTVPSPFLFCDQLLKVSYITSGCAVNTVIAGTVSQDVEVTADVSGENDTAIIKIGNPCACGSSLNAKRNPDESICIGTSAHILIWATMSGAPAVGYSVRALLTGGCGTLSSNNKILGTASLLNEAAHTFNTVTGITQVETAIDIASGYIPSVYLSTDTNKTTDLYSSHSGKIIDLTTPQSTGVQVVIDYEADGATLISWMTTDIEKDCDGEVTVTMADGTEAGGRTVLTLSTKDCTISDSIPDHNGDYSVDDPDSDDQSNEEGYSDSTGGDDDFGEPVDPCLTTIMDRILNADTAISDDARDGIRFGVKSASDCPDNAEFECPCSELCDSEMHESGNTYDYSKTIHETVIETYEEGTPEYYEAFEVLKQENLEECAIKCEQKRLNTCSECELVSGPATLVPGESAEYVCNDGTSGLITMPVGACGTHTFTLGCCTFEVRSTVGAWVETDYISQTIYGSGGCFNSIDRTSFSYDTRSESPVDVNTAGTAYSGIDYRICGTSAYKESFDTIYCPQYATYQGASGLVDLDDCLVGRPIKYYDLLGYQHIYRWSCV